MTRLRSLLRKLRRSRLERGTLKLSPSVVANQSKFDWRAMPFADEHLT